MHKYGYVYKTCAGLTNLLFTTFCLSTTVEYEVEGLIAALVKVPLVFNQNNK